MKYPNSTSYRISVLFLFFPEQLSNSISNSHLLLLLQMIFALVKFFRIKDLTLFVSFEAFPHGRHVIIWISFIFMGDNSQCIHNRRSEIVDTGWFIAFKAGNIHVLAIINNKMCSFKMRNVSFNIRSCFVN